MELKILKKFFNENILISPEIVPSETTENGWLLVLHKTTGGAVTVSRSANKGQKIYKSVRGALSDAKQIGFKEVVVKFD